MKIVIRAGERLEDIDRPAKIFAENGAYFVTTRSEAETLIERGLIIARAGYLYLAAELSEIPSTLLEIPAPSYDAK